MIKVLVTILISLVLVVLAFGIGFQSGRSSGFETGSQWALMQASIVAREAGFFMPVYLDEGSFRLVVKQRHGLYKKAWQQADHYEEARAGNDLSPREPGAESTIETTSSELKRDEGKQSL